MKAPLAGDLKVLNILDRFYKKGNILYRPPPAGKSYTGIFCEITRQIRIIYLTSDLGEDRMMPIKLKIRQ